MEIIKDKNLVTREYVDKLKDWILENQETYFSNKDNEANHWQDFDFFNQTTDRKHLIMKDEVMLVDRADDGGVHCYMICRILGNSKKPRSRVEHVAKVINIDDLDGNDWRNGYFLLPKL